MIKLNDVIYNKLQLQAEEAKEQGMIKLASAIEGAIGNESQSGDVEYSYQQMNEDVYKELWKAAKSLIAFYDFDSVDAEKLDKSLVSWAVKIIDDLEDTLGVSNSVKGPLEPRLPGEDLNVVSR